MIPSTTAVIVVVAFVTKGSPFARFSKKAADPEDILLAVSRKAASCRSLTSLKPLMRYMMPSTVAFRPTCEVAMKGSPFDKFSRKEALPEAILSAVAKKLMSCGVLILFKLPSKLTITSESLGTTSAAFSTKGSLFAMFSRKTAEPKDILLAVSKNPLSSRSLTLLKPLMR